MPDKIAAIIPAAGFGTRMKLDYPKQYYVLNGVPVLVRTVRIFVDSGIFSRIVVVVPEDRLSETNELFTSHDLLAAEIKIVAGGHRRQDSVRNGLKTLEEEIDIVFVHDGARPLLSQEVIQRCYEGVLTHQAVIAAVPVKDTLKRSDTAGKITATIDRTDLWQAQTPQVARKDLLQQAFADNGEGDVTDEASLLEKAGIPVTLVNGSETNIKITRPEDLLLAARILAEHSPLPMRIGHGYDAHRFAPERTLVLGGISIPYDLGLAGHSDADVLTHALCDAILGAIGEGDIGRHFPDNDQSYKNIYSIKLLENVVVLAKNQGYRVGNADITVVCQAPKLAPFIDEMRKTVAQTCQIAIQQINIKATTTEKMGFTGRKEGISCHAVVLLEAIAREE